MKTTMKKTMKTVICMMMILTMALGLSGCGDSEKKQEAIDIFNETSTVFDETADLINANLDVIDDATISTYQEMSDALTECKDALESDEEAPDEDYQVMIDSLTEAKEWLEEAKGEIEAQVSAAGE